MVDGPLEQTQDSHLPSTIVSHLMDDRVDCFGFDWSGHLKKENT